MVGGGHAWPSFVADQSIKTFFFVLIKRKEKYFEEFFFLFFFFKE
jgi:hypothetical protein